MRPISRAPWLPLAVVVGLLCLPSTSSSDQYPRGNRGLIRSASYEDDYGAAWVSGEAGLRDAGLIVVPNKWGSRRDSESQDDLYEIVFAAANSHDNLVKPNIPASHADELVAYRAEQTKATPRGEPANEERPAGRRLDNLRKRSSGEASAEEAEQPAMSLQELLRHWGIDTSARGQRGDIEVTEPAPDYRGRGDVPAGLLRSKRQALGRKLLWQPEEAWGYGENDGYQADQPRGDEYADEEEQRRYLKGAANGHHRKHHHGRDNEIRRLQEEEEARRRQEEEDNERMRREEEERRRQHEEQERRRSEEERRRRPEAKAEAPRREPEERRGPATSPEEHMSYEERLRQWQHMKEQYDQLVRDRHSGRNRNRTKSPEELENERKLQDYIRRNTPIDVSGRRPHHNRTQPPASSQRRPEEPEDRRYQSPAPPGRNSEYEEQLRRRQEEEERRRREEEHRRQLQEEERRRYEQEEEERRRREEEEEENLRREQPPRVATTSASDDEQRMRENEAIRQAEHQRRLEQEQRRRLVEEQSRRYEEQQRKRYEARTRAPAETENAEQDRRRLEASKRPYQPGKMEPRDERYDEAKRPLTESPEPARETNTRKRPTDSSRKTWTERPAAPSAQPDGRRTESDRRDWPGRNAEENTGYPDRRRPDQKGWLEEENRRKYLELKKHSDTVSRHGGRPAPSLTSTTSAPINTRRHEEAADEDEDEEERLRRLESVPVAARITPRPAPGNDTQHKPPQLTSRLGGVVIDFPGFSPQRKGAEASRFPAPVTARAPAKSPKPCVWAIVVCCRDPRNVERQTRCFEATDCLSWDESRCRDDNVRAANRELMNFYINSRASFQ